jgi:hypothetical protein
MPFGTWPPGTNAVLVGRAFMLADGTLSYSSHYPDGTPVFATAKASTGVYNITYGKPTRIQVPTLEACVVTGTTARFCTVASTQVRVFDGANAAADGGLELWLWDVG